MRKKRVGGSFFAPYAFGINPDRVILKLFCYLTKSYQTSRIGFRYSAASSQQLFHEAQAVGRHRRLTQSVLVAPVCAPAAGRVT